MLIRLYTTRSIQLNKHPTVSKTLKHKLKLKCKQSSLIASLPSHFIKTNYITKTEVLPKDERESCQAGEMARLNFNVKCVDNSVNQDQLLFYEIVCDSNNWAPAGKNIR